MEFPSEMKQEFGETVEGGLSLLKYLRPPCRANPGAHLSGSLRGTSPATTLSWPEPTGFKGSVLPWGALIKLCLACGHGERLF